MLCVFWHNDGPGNLHYFRDNIFTRQTDLGVGAVRAELSHPLSGARGPIWGLAYAPGRLSLNDFRAAPPPGFEGVFRNNAMIYNVRLLQHEISHNFGIPDHYCTPDQLCIMNHGFNSRDDFGYSRTPFVKGCNDISAKNAILFKARACLHTLALNSEQEIRCGITARDMVQYLAR